MEVELEVVFEEDPDALATPVIEANDIVELEDADELAVVLVEEFSPADDDAD